VSKLVPPKEYGIEQAKTVYFSRKDGELPIVIDSGASYSVTPNLQDFVGPIRECSTKELNGLNAPINVVGEGEVDWKIQDVFGIVRSIKTTAYYVPEASVRLFSPQIYFLKWKHGSYLMDHAGTRLTLKDGTSLTFPYNSGSSLPLMLTTKHFNRSSKFVGLTCQDGQTLGNTAHLSAFLNVADETNQNLSPAEKELLLWHQRLGHAYFQRVQQMLCQPRGQDLIQVLKPKNQASSACSRPLCAACQLAKQTRQGAGVRTTVPVPETLDELTRNKLEPGQTVSIDQYMSATHGRLAHTKGKEAKSKKYTGGTLFIDHATQYIHCRHQVSLRVGETLKAKNDFERFAKESGRTIKNNHADNAPFRVAEFVQDCTNKGQTIDYSGVGAHHQNGVAERSIRTVTTWARAMMLHSIIHWPAEARPDLWPMALDQAIYLWNNMPQRGTRMAPTELFTATKFLNYNHLQRAHVWGCPVYVLDPMLQDGKKLPKWRPRARRGFYVGVSQRHSTNIGRVLNLQTGHISDQFHCVYDDHFATVSCPGGNPFEAASFDVTSWNRILESGYE
jgi:hypothetical protein